MFVIQEPVAGTVKKLYIVYDFDTFRLLELEQVLIIYEATRTRIWDVKMKPAKNLVNPFSYLLKIVL